MSGAISVRDVAVTLTAPEWDALVGAFSPNVRWPVAAVIADLRCIAFKIRVGRMAPKSLPPARVLGQRWGWSRAAASAFVRDVSCWQDPSSPVDPQMLFGATRACSQQLPVQYDAPPRRRRASGMRTPLSSRLRFEVFKRDGFKCVYCGQTREGGARLHADHVRPVSAGGLNDLTNLVTACEACNLGKGAMLMEVTP